MGLTFPKGIEIISAFKSNAPVPMSVWSIVDTRQDLNLPTNASPGVIPADVRFISMTSFVMDEGLEYQLIGGTTDAHWTVKGSGEATIKAWSNDTEYVEGQIIWVDGSLWRCKTTHTSPVAPATFEDDATNFENASADSYTNTAPSLAAVGGIPAGSTFDELTFAEFVEKTAYPNLPPTVTLTANPAFGLRERGVAIPSITLSATFAKTKNDVDYVEFFKNGASIGTPAITTPAGETLTQNSETLDGLTDTTYSVEVTDTDDLEATQSGAFTFANASYIGSLAPTLTAATATEADVTAMTKRIANKGPQSNVYTVSNQKIAFCYPTAWGPLTSIKDANGFENLPAFESAQLTVENAASEQVPMTLYVGVYPSSPVNFLISFIF